MSLLVLRHTALYQFSSSTLFEQDSDALAAADAGRPDAQRLVVAPELVDEVAADAGAGGAERVTDGDGAAARVELWGGTQSNQGGCYLY